MRAAVPLLAVLLVLTVPLAVPPVQGQEPVAVFVEVPSHAGTGKAVPVNVTVAGGPGANNGSFQIRVFLRGDDLSGADPREDSPLERTSEDGQFGFNVTMPTAAGRVELVVEANSSRDDLWRSATTTRTVEVLVPLRASAPVTNTGSVAVRNVTAYLLIDGRQVAETQLDRLGPGETRVLSFEYLPVGLQPGSHTLQIWVDLNGNGVADPGQGEVVLEEVFTKEAEPLNPLFIVLGVVGAFVAALFVGAYLRRRRGG